MRRALEGGAIAAPMLVGLLVPARMLPAPLAFLFVNGWWLQAGGWLTLILSASALHALSRLAAG